jgi:DNA polymerase I
MVVFKMDKCHIIDGNNFFSRVYFAGGNTLQVVVNAFIQSTRKWKGDIIFCFDTTKSKRRLEIYPEYKAGRKSSLSPEEYEQFKKMMYSFMDILKNMKVRVLEGDDYEADDYIAVLSKSLKRFHVYIHSTDQDFYQLISENVTVVKPSSEGDTEINVDNFTEVTGVDRKFFLDCKSMCGDKSDNIPGIEGIGPGKASKYINEYGSYQEIVEALKLKLNETVKSKRPNATEMKIVEGEEGFKLARQLIDLSICYTDKNLIKLVKDKANKTKLDLDKVLEILTEWNSEACFDVITAYVKK